MNSALSPDAARARREGQAAMGDRRLEPALGAFQRYESLCDCPEGAFLCGRALLELERLDSARLAFERALQRDPRHLPARRHLALVQERLGRWKDAATTLEIALADDGVPLADSARAELRRSLEADRQRLRILRESGQNPPPRRLDDHVNSSSDDYMPHLSLDGRLLSFTSNRPGGLDRAGRAGLHREDLWQSTRQPGGWRPAAILAGAVNTIQPEGSGSSSADGQCLVFSACDRPDGSGDCDLYQSGWSGRGWSAGLPLAAVNSPAWDSQPALAADASLLIFASNRPGGLGGSDLWCSRRDSLGRFGPPVNLGSPVNTAGEEAGPFLHMDGRSLYFSSDGHVGFGGLDFFLSRLGDDGRWGEPVNLGPPLSTPHPDLGLCLAGDGRQAVFASRREGRPDLDLYETQMPACCPAEAVWLLTGRVVEAGSGQPLAARLRVEPFASVGPAWRETRADSLGRFSIVLPAGEQLIFADEPDHLFTCGLLRVGGEGASGPGTDGFWQLASPPDTLRLELAPLERGARLELAPLRFDFDRSEIRPEGLPLLRQVLKLLDARPELRIELRGHTDDVGGTQHNLELSQWRAEAVKAWLVGQGVAPERIAAVGVGDQEPREKGDDVGARAANRRTEMWLR